jgi:hypothetical protein
MSSWSDDEAGSVRPKLNTVGTTNTSTNTNTVSRSSGLYGLYGEQLLDLKIVITASEIS